MAKKVQDEKVEAEAGASVPTEKVFRSLLKKLTAAESELSELKGEMGSAVERAVASHNLHTDALRVVRKYIKKNPGQAAEFKLHLDTYWDYERLGQPDDDLIETRGQRRGRMAKADERAGETEQPRGRAAAAHEPVLSGDKVIRGGKVVSINGDGAEAEAEAATA